MANREPADDAERDALADVSWAVINRKFHRLDSPSTPAVTLCGATYRGWVWDTVAVLKRERAESRLPVYRRTRRCQGCILRARRLARIAAGTALFMPARLVTPEQAQEQIRRRRAQELAALDRESRSLERPVSARSASAGLPSLGKRRS